MGSIRSAVSRSFGQADPPAAAPEGCRRALPLTSDAHFYPICDLLAPANLLTGQGQALEEGR